MKKGDYERINSKVREKKNWKRMALREQDKKAFSRRKWSHVLNNAKSSNEMMIKKFQLYVTTWMPPESQKQLQWGCCVRSHTVGNYERDLR